MKRVNCILHNEKYKEYCEKLNKLEKGRKYCKHGMNHFLNVARIAYIINLENGYGIDKEVIYAAALLHDIGRILQIEENIPHDKGSVMLSKEILIASEFSDEEIKMIQEAIGSHRKKPEDSVDESDKTRILCRILYKADKLSRNCFKCKAIDSCNWSKKKKNIDITL